MNQKRNVQTIQIIKSKTVAMPKNVIETIERLGLSDHQDL